MTARSLDPLARVLAPTLGSCGPKLDHLDQEPVLARALPVGQPKSQGKFLK
jgi:hypothetical protein